MNLTRDFWEKAYKENAPKIIGVCRRYVSSKEIAEDLAHDAFLTAISKFESYRGKGHFEAWLRKIAVNTALMYLRAKNAERILEDWTQNESEYQAMEESNAYDLKSIISQAEFSGPELMEIIDQLPEHHRQVFNLYVIDNFSHVQIGEALHISPGTSKSHLSRARKRVQQLLYDKALEKLKDQQKRKRAGFLLLLFPLRSFSIDHLFRSKLNSISIPPSKAGIDFDRIDWSSLPSARQPIFRISKTYTWLGIAATGLTILFLATMSSWKPIVNRQIPPLVPEKTTQFDTIQRFIAEPNASKSPLKQILKAKPYSNEEDADTVFIQQTVIQRKTIIIHDTIRIPDTSHAK